MRSWKRLDRFTISIGDESILEAVLDADSERSYSYGTDPALR